MDFETLNINTDILKALAEKGYLKPTPIQEQAIPPIMEGRDLLGSAETGTGKTAAFALPILDKLSKDSGEKNGAIPIKALILGPTRELVMQIGESFNDYGKYLDFHTGVVYGGVTPKRHLKVLKREPRVVVATPGRLLDLIERGAADLSHVEQLVLDEADRMLELGMAADVMKILALLPKQKQTMLFSATMPEPVRRLVNSLLNNPVRIDLKPVKTTLKQVEQQVFFVEEMDKTTLLLDLLKSESYESVLIFVRTKKKADKVSKAINVANIKGVLSKPLHSDKNQSEREKVMARFKQKDLQILVATDVAARGIDIEDLSWVINMDIPKVMETYTHRIGRTGRAGKGGKAIAFCSDAEIDDLREIEKYQGLKLTVVTPK